MENVIIEVKLQPTDPRYCDYCSKICAVWSDDFKALVVVEDCSRTPYGLMCADCLAKSDEQSRKDGELRIRRYVSHFRGDQYLLTISEIGEPKQGEKYLIL